MIESLKNIQGLGAKRLEILKEAGIGDRSDLAAVFPIAYFDIESPVFADGAHDHCAVRACLTGNPTLHFARKGLSITRIRCEDEVGNPFTVIYYNRPYLKNQMQAGEKFYFFGDLTDGKTKSMLNPIAEPADGIVPKGLYPVYPSVAGIPKTVLRDAVLDCVRTTAFCSAIPEAMRITYGLEDLGSAYRTLHMPSSFDALASARRTVAVEETVQLCVMFRAVKANADRNRCFRYENKTDAVRERLAKLPYTLTGAQQRAIEEILGDLASPFRMNRLLQGDVGSGKTVVAFAAAYFSACNERQVAIMAPTEVLAHQHFRNYCAVFGDWRVILLTGGMKPSEKARAQAAIASGEALVIIGTHSLFQAKVEYRNLSLVITDEQHRFGVGQRAAIEEKGGQTDTLIMSATPIPRTMALLVYGDLDVSVLDEKPRERREIITRYVPSHKIADMYGYLREDAARDRRSYIIVPRVEDEEESGNSVKRVFEQLSHTEFAGIPCGILYGAMKEKEKNAALRAFETGETKILVSTTVVEVGVDVREACNMVILDAERFGLAQLHQLRGRVGRGDAQSYCFLVSESKSPVAKERMDFLCACTDGFRIADYDLETRGAGDFIGMSQHGFASGLARLSLKKSVIDDAREIADALILNGEPVALKEKYRRIVQNVTMN